MARGAPITEAERQRIRELHTQGFGRNRIAAEIGRSVGTVTKVAKQLGLKFDREATKVAVEAARVDDEARRQKLAHGLLGTAEKIHEQMWQPHVAFNFGGKENTYAEQLMDEPPVEAKLKQAQTITTLLRDHTRLVEFGQDKEGLAAVDAWMKSLLDGQQ